MIIPGQSPDVTAPELGHAAEVSRSSILAGMPWDRRLAVLAEREAAEQRKRAERDLQAMTP